MTTEAGTVMEDAWEARKLKLEHQFWNKLNFEHQFWYKLNLSSSAGQVDITFQFRYKLKLSCSPVRTFSGWVSTILVWTKKTRRRTTILEGWS